MKIEINLGHLRDALNAALVALPGHNQCRSQPIFRRVLLDAQEGVLTVTARDLDIDIRVKAPAQVSEPGQACVPARPLALMTRGVQEDVILETTENHALRLTSGSVEATLNGTDSLFFPPLPETEAPLRRFMLPSLANIKGVLAACVGREEIHPILSGIACRLRDGTMELVGSDGYRMAVLRLPVE